MLQQLGAGVSLFPALHLQSVPIHSTHSLTFAAHILEAYLARVAQACSPT